MCHEFNTRGLSDKNIVIPPLKKKLSTTQRHISFLGLKFYNKVPFSSFLKWACCKEI